MTGLYDAVLLVSFGGPEHPDEVMPFLRRVTRGRGVPDERLEEVAEHYHHFGGVSPINGLNRELAASLQAELEEHGPRIPLYFGNRFHDPFLKDTLKELVDAGKTRVLAIATSAFGSYSGCRAYRDDLDRALAELGEDAPRVDKLPPFGLEPGYIETCTERLQDALAELPDARVLFSAHSIPRSMAASCNYVDELSTLAREVAERAGVERWDIVYQSRSGPPSMPWLEPDVADVIRTLPEGSPVIVAPFGFVADHMEVVWDLDVEARKVASDRGIPFGLARTANAHPRFVRMLRELVAAAEQRPPAPCPPDCCAPPRRRA